jgi:hypothetical protein
MQSVLRNSPLERGAFSIVEMEKAGCVKMITTMGLTKGEIKTIIHKC